MNGDDRDGEAPTTERGGLTSLINRMIDGDQQAGNAVAERLYQDWRAQARRRMKREGPGHVLETDALVNTSLRRMLQAGTPVNDRYHFRNLLQLYMNFSLSSYGRKRHRGVEETTIDGKQLVDPAPPPEPLSPDVRRALDTVRGLDPLAFEVVLMRVVFEFTFPEIAKAKGLTEAQAKYRYKLGRAWLEDALEKSRGKP
jgi:DNA-directed RNA polymerase specialized sigma24 family protein